MAKVIEKDIILDANNYGKCLKCIHFILIDIVVELGAGTALPSLLIAAHGHEVITTDLRKVLPLT